MFHKKADLCEILAEQLNFTGEQNHVNRIMNIFNQV